MATPHRSAPQVEIHYTLHEIVQITIPPGDRFITKNGKKLAGFTPLPKPMFDFCAKIAISDDGTVGAKGRGVREQLDGDI